jgi:hypothetical protein
MNITDDLIEDAVAVGILHIPESCQGHRLEKSTLRSMERLAKLVALQLNRRLQSDAVELEKVLCKALGREWEPEGISAWTLISILGERQAAPSGWKLVPIEPTDEMLDDGHEALDDLHHTGRFGECPGLKWGDAKACYQAMLSAAPSPELISPQPVVEELTKE